MDGVKSILEAPMSLMVRIAALSSEIEQLHLALAYPRAIRYDADKVQISPTNVMEEYMAVIDAKERERDKLIAELPKSHQRIHDLIKSLSEIDKSIITMRYIGLKGWRNIGRATHFSGSGAWKRHNKILHELETQETTSSIIM